MQVLKQATPEQRRRLLELFPVTALRSYFNMTGTKEAIAAAMAQKSDSQSLRKLVEFCNAHFAICRQHVYVLSHDSDVELPESFSNAQQILGSSTHALYIVKRHFKVVLLDPPANDSIEFLWPILLEMREQHLIVRFVVLEKAISAYFDRAVVVLSKTPTEDTMVAGLLVEGTLSLCDLNKGVKALWAKDLIDGTRFRYDLPNSHDTKSMHERKGLKKTDLDAYNELRKRPLRMCTFEGKKTHSDVGVFSVNPTEGFIGFTHYAKEGSSGDELIEQILKSN